MLETYGGGRASVREALRILETNGLVNIRQARAGGAVVGRVDPVQFGRSATRYSNWVGPTVRELIEARLILEPATPGWRPSAGILPAWSACEGGWRTTMTARTGDDATYLSEFLSSSTPSSLGCRATWSLDLITLP